MHNANTEKEQTNVLSYIIVLLEGFDVNTKKTAKYGRKYEFFDSKLDVQGGNPTIKRSLLLNLLNLENLVTYVIFGEEEIRNLNGSL